MTDIKIEELNASLEAARVKHRETLENQDKVSTRHKGAVAAHAEAIAGRQRLADEAGRGANLAPKSVLAAEEDLRLAKASLRIWTDAAAAATAKVTEAEKSVADAMRAIGDYRFSKACAARIELAEKLTQNGKEQAALFSAWLATGDEIQAAWALGRPPASHELESLKDWRFGAAVVPEKLQIIITQRGGPFVVDLGARERNAWGAWAAKE